MQKTLLDCDEAWTLDFIKSKREPIMMIATGSMKQLPSITGFQGRSVEEKCYITPLALQAIPCTPLVSEKLKDMVHPEVGPTLLGEGVKEGYFFVYLSWNQNFEDGVDFIGLENLNGGQSKQQENVIFVKQNITVFLLINLSICR